ncbi:MAG: BT_3928 family protein [Muribaculaceae bacterium]
MPRKATMAVWAMRVLTGAMFVLSGWAKSVDPYGTVYKMEEYFAVWGFGGFPREITIVLAVGLAALELTLGVALVLGCLRRSTPISALVVMAVMLPLSVYLAVAEPVAHCGCFGDLWVISNTATLIKNVVLTAMLVLLLKWHEAAQPLIRPWMQWMVLAATIAYSLVLSFVGWQFQPVVDFRQYPVGSTLVAEESEVMPTYIYEKDGERREFALDALPDSTWTFVEVAQTVKAEDELAVFDGDDDVTFDVLAPEEGDCLLLVVSEPSVDVLSRSRFTNELAEYAQSHDIRFIGIVAASGQNFDIWKQYARPNYEVYSAADTALKQLARGSTALVMLHDGCVAWKRNFSTLSPELMQLDDPIEEIIKVDNGHVSLWLAGAFVAIILSIYLLGLIVPRPRRKPKPTQSETPAENV